MISDIILYSLIHNRAFARKTISHIKGEYFETIEGKKIFTLIKDYIVKYKNLPTINSLKTELAKDGKLNENTFNTLSENIDNLKRVEDSYDDTWLINNCEEWCKERALHNAILDSVTIIESKKATGAIPEIIRKALQVEFETTIGIEFLDNKGIDSRWKEYHKENLKFSTGIDPLDAITDGGLEPKSLSIIMSGTSAGKSSAMCSMAANFIRNGYNVLYVTLEMSEEKIAQRIDANFLDVDINDVPMLKEETYKKHLHSIQNKTKGRLVIKEYPPALLTTNKLRSLLEDLKVKIDFMPQIVIVDYLNLMNSDRVKSENLYSYIKSIAEELRGLAVDLGLAILSATQGNRATNDENSSDMDLTNVSESIGLAATADFLVGIIFPVELREQGIQIWKILKNRFGGIVNFKIPLRVNFARARLTAMDSQEKEGIKISDNSVGNNAILKKEESRQKYKNTLVVDASSDVVEDILDFIS